MSSFKIILLSSVFLLGSGAKAQIIYDTLSNSIESHVLSDAGNTNYGSNAILKVEHSHSLNFDSRAFVKFDLTAIPANAIITNATLEIYSTSTIGSSNRDLFIERVDSTWYEDSITWNNQSTSYFSDQIEIHDSIASDSGYQSFSVRDHVELMTNYEHLNFGWIVRLQNENDTSDFGVEYASSDHDSIHWRPRLIINYVLPIDITIHPQHCTNGNNDGSYEVEYTGGSQGALNYYWVRKRTDTTFVNLEYGYFPHDSVLTRQNLDPGLYQLVVRDSLYNVDNEYHDLYIGYKWFLIGEEGKTTDLIFHSKGENYSEDIYFGRGTHTDPNHINTISDADKNYNYKNQFGPSYAVSSPTFGYDFVGAVRFNIDFDQSLEFSKADYIASKHYYYNGSVSTNEIDCRLINEWWEDEIVTWNTRPDVDSTIIISLPTVQTAGYGGGPDTIGILPFVEYWQDNPDDNWGFELSLNSYTQTQSSARLFRDCAFDIPTGPQLKLSFTVKPPVTSFFNDTTELGTIFVDAPEGDLPYTYLLSYDPLPDLNDIWQLIKDSISTDSTTFFAGDLNSRNFVFENIEPERYYVGVYDNNGVRILNNETILGPEISFISSEDIRIEGRQLSVEPTYSQAFGTVDGLIDQTENGGFEFKIEELGDMALGLISSSKDPASLIDHFDFGLNLNMTGSTYEVYIDGVNSHSASYQLGDVFRISKQGYDVVYYQNNLEIYREANSPNAAIELRSDLIFKGSLGKISNFLMLENLAVNKFKPVKAIVSNTECDLDNGRVDVKLTNSPFYPSGSATYVLTNLTTNTVVQTGSVTASTLSIPLPTGKYKIDFFWNGINSWTEIFTISNSLDWDLLDNYLSPFGPGINPLTATSNTNSGSAISQNILSDGGLGYAEFKHKLFKKTNVFGNTNIPIGISNVTVSMKNSSNQEIIKTKVWNFGFNILNRYVSVYDENNSLVGNITTYSNGPIQIGLEANGANTEFNVYQGNSVTPFATVQESTTSDYKVFVSAYSGVIYDPFATFCKGVSNSEQCGHLDYELDGNYYVTTNGKFCFVYNEEYNDENIEFNIYTQSGHIIANQNSFQNTINLNNYDGVNNVYLPELIHGENRIVLDFTPSGYCIGSGMFILEVINDKKEKFYLRIRNASTTCLPYPDVDGAGLD